MLIYGNYMDTIYGNSGYISIDSLAGGLEHVLFSHIFSTSGKKYRIQLYGNDDGNDESNYENLPSGTLNTWKLYMEIVGIYP